MPTPLAFEVFRNGRKLCTAGLRGSPGVMTTFLTWMDGAEHDSIELAVGALESETGDYLTWAQRSVSTGDEITIRIVESSKTTRIRSRRLSDKKADEKAEKVHMRKTAAKYGYRLVKAPRRPNR